MTRIFLLLFCLIPMMGMAVQQSPEENAKPQPEVILSAESKASEQIEMEPDSMPQFQDGDVAAFQRWVMLNLRYPTEAMENGIQGRVLVKLIVEKDGSVSVAGIVRSPDPLLTAEVLRVLATAPSWSPGLKNNRPVRVQFSLPIDFRMQ